MHRSVFQEKKNTQLPILSDLTESNIIGDITSNLVRSEIEQMLSYELHDKAFCSFVFGILFLSVGL